MDLDWAARPELARAVVAGWVTGAIVGLTCLAILLIGLSRESAWATRVPHLRVGLPLLGVVAANAMLFGWTIVGVLAGFAYWARPGILYSIGLVAIGAFVGLLYWIVRSGARGSEPAVVWSSLVVVVVMFAVVMPLLAESL